MENIVYTITERNVILRQVSIALKIMVDIVFHWIIKLAIKIMVNIATTQTKHGA